MIPTMPSSDQREARVPRPNNEELTQEVTEMLRDILFNGGLQVGEDATDEEIEDSAEGSSSGPTSDHESADEVSVFSTLNIRWNFLLCTFTIYIDFAFCVTLSFYSNHSYVCSLIMKMLGPLKARHLQHNEGYYFCKIQVSFLSVMLVV